MERMNIEKLLKIIDEEQDHYNWGGSEDQDGGLDRGPVDFDRIREAIKQLAKDKEKPK